MISHDREQRKLHTRNIILDAAITIFAEAGFEAASLGAIGKRCDTKKSLVQYHFETKEKLWKAAIDRLWSQLRDAFPSVVNGAGACGKQETLRCILKQLIHFITENPAWIGIVLREAASPGPRLDWLVENYLKEDFANGTRFITKAQQQGLLPDAPPVHLLHIISGSLTYALFFAPLAEKATGIDLTSEESLETVVNTLMLMLSVNTRDIDNTPER